VKSWGRENGRRRRSGDGEFDLSLERMKEARKRKNQEEDVLLPDRTCFDCEKKEVSSRNRRSVREGRRGRAHATFTA